MLTPNSRKHFSALLVSIPGDVDSKNVVGCNIRLVGGLNPSDPEEKDFHAGTIS